MLKNLYSHFTNWNVSLSEGLEPPGEGYLFLVYMNFNATSDSIHSEWMESLAKMTAELHL